MDEIDEVKKKPSYMSEHKFLLLIAYSIIISLILVGISLQIYNESGAAQLDLSRPGYRSVQSKAITNDNELQTYPNTGTVTLSTVQQFELLYNKESQQVTSIDAYGGDPLNPDALEISTPTTNQ
jgi:hypothetical protein